MHTPQLFDEPDYWGDQHPGCHTHSSGFDYILFKNPADKEIDKAWAMELYKVRGKLVQLLTNKILK